MIETFPFEFSERERAAVLVVFGNRQWAGPGDATCDLWRTLRLSELRAAMQGADRERVNLELLGDARVPYDLTRAEAIVLLTLVSQPQQLGTALYNSDTLNRLVEGLFK
jgi:hypothetical protein